jgi:GT2 family glycosyltransferase
VSHDAYCVVVPAYQAGATIDRCLTALRQSTPPPAEIIVYDDGSTDDTAEIARRHGARILSGSTPCMGPGAGRNAGVKAAQHDVVVFVDADVVVESDGPGRLARAVAEDAGIHAAFGAYTARSDVSNLAGQYANLRHHHTHWVCGGGDVGCDAETFWSGLGAVDRRAFLSVGGFDAAYGRPCIEDVELGVRLRKAGGRIRLIPAAQGEHLKNWTLAQLWKTDVFHRAVPWSELIARGGAAATLNTSRTEKLKSLLAHLIWVGLLAALVLTSPWLAVATLGFVALYLYLNRGLLRLLGTQSRRLAVAGAGLHWFYHTYASGVCALILAREGLRTPMRRRSRFRLRRRNASAPQA